MSITCSKAFAIGDSQADMPLDQAVYTGAGRNCIYGVRGGYVYKFDVNGVKLASARYTGGECFGNASIAYDNVGDGLYCAFWNEGSNTGTVGATNRARGIWTINQTTLAGTFTDLTTLLGFSGTGTNVFDGPHQIVADAGYLYGAAYDSPTPHCILFELNLPALTVANHVHNVSSRVDSWYDLLPDFNLAAVWEIGGGAWDGVTAYDLVGGTFNTSNLGISEGLVGMCQWTTSPFWLYAVNRTDVLVKIESANAGLFNLYDLSASDASLSTMRPYRVRYNPVDGKVYIPDPVGNRVVVWTPAAALGGDSLSSVKTGFDTPFDVVFTAAKKFAVQQGAVGLKEIT